MLSLSGQNLSSEFEVAAQVPRAHQIKYLLFTNHKERMKTGPASGLKLEDLTGVPQAII